MPAARQNDALAPGPLLHHRPAIVRDVAVPGAEEESYCSRGKAKEKHALKRRAARTGDG